MPRYNARHHVFHKSLAEPENIRAEPFGMGEIARIINSSNQFGRRGQAAGRVYIAAGILTDAKMSMKFILRMIFFPENEKDLVQMGFADAQISMLFGAMTSLRYSLIPFFAPGTKAGYGICI